ncbi:MAG TPA: histidine kinase [Pseudonocardiaceae bacterium]
MRAAGLRARLRRRAERLGRRSLAFDAVTGLLITALGLFGAWLLTGPLAEVYARLGLPVATSTTVAVAGTALMTAPLMVRRLFPLPALAVITVAYLWVGLARVPEYVSSSIALLVGVYTVGAYARRWSRTARAAHLAVVATVAVVQLARADYGAVPLDGAELALFALYDKVTAVLVSVVAFTFAWILGDTVRRSRAREAELAARTAELAAANRTITRQAVADERLRIARELHDVVAHHVSVMGLQAGAARRVLDHDREAAVRALHVVEDTGRLAVDELQRLLGMLRDRARDDGEPQPTMGDLARLLERMRDTGLDVRVRVSGAQPPLPAGVELSVYRVVQEALTNVLKHAGTGARVEVDLGYTPERLRLLVRSRPAAGARRPAPATTTNGTRDGEDGGGTGDAGRGLIGMRERIVMHGGELSTRPLGDGAFEVLATIPV